MLFDILIAGGLLGEFLATNLKIDVQFYIFYTKIFVTVPGGSISQDGEKPRTNYCIFDAPEDMESMRNHEQVCNTFP